MERTPRIARRAALVRAASGLGALAGLAPATLRAQDKPETLGLGLIGSGGRGQTLVRHFLKQPHVEFHAVCDVYEPNLKAGLQATSPTSSGHSDYRELLDRKDVAAVIVATPDHWHARMTVDALEAGKDVYVEKPLGHTVEDGFRVVDAVKRTGRLVQVGTQRRSYPLFQDGKKVFAEAGLGAIKLVSGWWFNQQAGLSSGSIDGKLDWERWLGSAPKREQDGLRFRNWYYFWDYSGGLMVGQLAHVIDAIIWFMGSSYPLTVTASNGRPHLAGAEVPETTHVAIEYPEDYLVSFNVAYQTMRYPTPRDQLIQYHGLKARFDIGRESFALHRESMERETPPAVEKTAFGTFTAATDAHTANFLDCVRTRKTPNAPAEAGHHVNVALCMAMESLRSGRRVRWNAEKRAME